LLTDRDLEVLRYIAQLRAENMTHEQVNQRLAETKIGETETLVQSLPAPEETLQDPPMTVQSPSDALQAYQAALTVMARMEERYTSLQTQIDNLDKRQASRLTYIVMGVIIGLFIAVVAILAIYAGAWLGG
jgi:DNA-binding transcriptional MerR regulator